MSDRLKDIVVTVTFVAFILFFFVINILKEPTDISIAERRKLNTLPQITVEKVINTKFMSEFESYALDQFVGRDTFRSIKAVMLYNILRQKDNNEVYVVDEHVSRYYANLNEIAVIDAAKKFNKVASQYLNNMNIYYSIIPDKNYYITQKYNYPHVDYTKLASLVNKYIKDMKYIDLFDILTLDDYYKTDSHWKQEKLGNVVNKIANTMNFEQYILNNYKQNVKEPFYGVYYGQSALPLPGEQLVYCTNSILENVKVKTLNEKTLQMDETKIYVEDNFNNSDPYDIYLGGAKPLIIIENPNANNSRELILFRDSFGSSITPLLIEAYSKITVIDLRYIASPLLKDFVEFNEGQDVLFLYSTEVINNSSTLKVM